MLISILTGPIITRFFALVTLYIMSHFGIKQGTVDFISVVLFELILSFRAAFELYQLLISESIQELLEDEE